MLMSINVNIKLFSNNIEKSNGKLIYNHNRAGKNRLYFGVSKSLQMVTAAMKLKDTYSLEGRL